MAELDELTWSGRRSYVVSIICLTVSSASVILRYVCKSMVRSGYHVDDLWILCTMLLYFVCAAANIWGIITGGGGREVTELLLVIGTPESLKKSERYMLTRFVAFTLSLVALFAVKMSLLSFYRRIFDTSRYRRATLVAMCLTGLWLTGTMLANFLVCKPIQKFWKPLTPGDCANYSIYFLGTGVLETAIDLFILLLPVQQVLTINIPLRNKIILSSIFMLGIFAIVTNIIRIKEIYQPGIELVSFSKAEVWTNVHLTVSIVCACSVTYKPLWGAIAGWFSNLRSTRSASIATFNGSPGANNVMFTHPQAPPDAPSEEMHNSTTPVPSYAHHQVPRARLDLDKELPPIYIRDPDGAFETHDSHSVDYEHPRIPRSAAARQSVRYYAPPPAYSSRAQSPAAWGGGSRSSSRASRPRPSWEDQTMTTPFPRRTAQG